MGQPIARVGDLVHGFCDGPGHEKRREFTGVFVSGSDVVGADDIAVVFVGDVGVTDCGHHFVAITGSSVAGTDAVAIHRVSDLVQVNEGGEGVTITGSDTITAE